MKLPSVQTPELGSRVRERGGRYSVTPGDHKEPSRAIPVGTVAAIGVSVYIYAAISFLFVPRAPRAELLTAPRILQAFARDNVFRGLKWSGRGSGRSGEPRRAIILTFVIAQAGILPGNAILVYNAGDVSIEA